MTGKELFQYWREGISGDQFEAPFSDHPVWFVNAWEALAGKVELQGEMTFTQKVKRLFE